MRPSGSFQIDRIVDEAGAAVAEELFRQYSRWVVSRLAADYGLVLDDAAVESAHRALRHELPQLLAGRGRLLVAAQGADRTGVAVLKPVDATTAEMKRVYVRPEARGAGMGRALVERVLDEARREGFSAVRLETLAFMTAAQKLYRAVGFVESGPFDGSEAAALGLEAVTDYLVIGL